MKARSLWFFSGLLLWGTGATWAQVATSGLIAEYRFVSCNGSTLSGSALPDCSGNGVNGTLTNHNGSGKPSADATGLNFNKDQAQTVDLPAGALANVVTIQILADWGNSTVQGNPGYFPLLGNVSNGFNITPKLFNLDENQGCTIQGNDTGNATSGYGAAWGPTVCTVVLDSGADTVYVNGTQATDYRIGSRHGNLGTVKSGVFQLGGSTGMGFYYSGHIYYAVFYNRALSSAEVAANASYLLSTAQARGAVLNPPNASTTNQLVFSGDSLTNGTGGGTPYSTYVSPSGTWTKSTFGIPAATCNDIGEAQNLVLAKYAAGAAKNVVMLWCGTNDEVNYSPAQALTNLSNLSALYRTAGFKVIVGTVLSGNYGTVNGGLNRDQWKNQFNPLVLANWRSFADGIADFTTDSNLTADGAYANTTYFTDQLHLSDVGYHHVAALVQAAVDGLKPAASPWYNPGWRYRKIKSIDHRRVLGTFSDFAVLIQFDNDPDLAGQLQSACQDFVVTLADGTKLDHEIVKCDAAGGTVHAFARVPSLSPDADTVLYVYFGNPSATDQSKPTGVWNSHYKAVYHFRGGSLADSTSNRVALTRHSTPTTAPGVYGDALYFDGIDDYLSTASMALNTDYTVQTWYKADTTAVPAAAQMPILGSSQIGIGWNGPNPASFYHAGASLTFPVDMQSGTSRWYSATLTRSSSTVSAYIDGSLKVTGTNGTALSNASYGAGGNGSQFFRGWLTEIRLLNTALPQGWQATEYNNQAHPELFFLTGSQETSTAATPSLYVFQATYTAVEPGKPTTLQWLAGRADSVSIDQGVGSQGNNLSGSVTVSPSATTTYTITAINSSGSSTAKVTINMLTGTPVAYLRASAPAGTWIRDYATDGSGHAVINASEPHNFAPGDYVIQYGLVTTDAGNTHNHSSNLNGHFIVKDVIDAGHYTITDLSGAYLTPNDTWAYGGTNPSYAGASWAGKATPFALVAGPRGFLDGTNGMFMRKLAVAPASLTVTSRVATVDLGYAHDVQVGDTVSVWNTKASGNLNGEHAVTAVAGTTITFATNSSNGDYTQNNICGPSAANPAIIGGTQNCVRISQYAYAANPSWSGILSATAFTKAADYQHKYDGGTCQFCGNFMGDYQWYSLSATYRALVDRKWQIGVDALVYTATHVERFDGVSFPANPLNGADEGGDLTVGHYGFSMNILFSNVYAVARDYLTSAQRSRFADAMLNDIWYADPAKQCKTDFPDYINVTTGTAQGGTGTTIQLGSDAAATDNAYVNNVITFFDGTSQWWYGTVTAYNGATRTATVGSILSLPTRSSVNPGTTAAAWPAPAAGTAYRVLATVTVSGTTVTGINSHFTTDFAAGDALLAQYHWGNGWPMTSSYVATIGSDTSLTIIPGQTGFPPAPTTPTPVFRIKQFSQANQTCGFHNRMMYTSGYQGAQPLQYLGWGFTNGMGSMMHNMPKLNQNGGGFEAAWDMEVGAALADDDPVRAIPTIELGQSYEYDWGYRFNIMYRGGFTDNGVWYGHDNVILGLGQSLHTMASIVSGFPLIGLNNEFAQNMQRIKTYMTLPDHPTTFAQIQIYGSNNSQSIIGPLGHYDFDWTLDDGCYFYPFSDTCKRLNQFTHDTGLDPQVRLDSAKKFPVIDPRAPKLDYKAQGTQYFFSGHTQKAACETAMGKLIDFLSCDWAHADGIISKTSWTDPSATQIMLESRATFPGYDTPEGGEVKIYKAGHLRNLDSGYPHSIVGSQFYGLGAHPEKNASMPEFNGGTVRPYRDYGHPLDVGRSEIVRWAGGTNYYGDAQNRYLYARADMTGQYDPTYKRITREWSYFKKPSTEEVLIEYNDIDASNQPTTSIRVGVHYAQNGEKKAPDNNYSNLYDEGATRCATNANCLNANTGVSLGNDETIISQESGAAADSTGPARTNGILTKFFSPSSFTLTWDGNTYPGAYGHTDRVSVSTNTAKLEYIQVDKITSSLSDTTLTASAINTAAGWAGVQTADKVAMFSRGGLLQSSVDFTTTHSGTAQYLIAGLAPGSYNVTVNGTAVVSGAAVGNKDNSLYFESTAGGVSIKSTTAVAVCSIGTTTLADAAAGLPYSQQIQTADCVAPVNWSVSGGALCSGLSLDPASGTITGVPDRAGACSFSVEAIDIAGYSATQDFAVTIAPPPPPCTLSTGALANGTVGVSYAQQVQTTNCATPVSWTVSAGALCDGLSLDGSLGTVSGIPATAQTCNFTLQATDSASSSGTQAYAVTISPTCTIGTTALSAARIRRAYSAQVQTSDCAAPASWNVTAGALCSGLSLDASTGMITGMPAQAGTCDFTVQVTDNRGLSAQRQFEVQVSAPSGRSVSGPVSWTGGTR
jgi:hypothetical protein